MDKFVVTMEEYQEYKLKERQALLHIIYFGERVKEEKIKRTELTNKGKIETEILCYGYRNPVKKVTCYIEKNLHMALVEWIYNDIESVVKNEEKNIETVTRRMKDLLRSNIYDKEKVDRILLQANKRMLVDIYMNCVDEIKEKGLDFYKYISPDELYALLQTERDMNTNSLDGKRYAAIDIAMREVSTNLNASVQQAGGIINWTSQRIKQGSKGAKKDPKTNFAYDKRRLLEGLYDENISEEDKQKMAKLLAKAKFNAKDLSFLISRLDISVIQVEEMYEKYSCLSSIVIGAMAELDLVFAITFVEVAKKPEWYGKIKWNSIKVEELKNTRYMCGAFDVAKFIVEMSKQGKRRLTEEEIDEILLTGEMTLTEKIRAYFTLTQNGLYSDDKMIELYGEKINEDNQENPNEQSSELDVTVEELLGFFNTDKVIAKMEGYCNPELEEEEKADNSKSNFLNFYLALLEASKIKDEGNVKQIQEEIATKLKERIQEGDTISLFIAIELLEKRIIDEEHVKEIFCEENQEKLIEMYQNEKIDDITLLTLYKKGFVEEYIVELIYQDIDSEQLKERIQQMSPEDALLLYCLGIIGQLDNKYLHDINWEKVAEIIPREKLRSKISVLYKNGNIGFDDVNKLKELKVIGAREADTILNQLDLNDIFFHGLTSEDGNGETGRKKKNEGAKRNEGIPLEDRNTHFINLGFEAIVNVYGAPMVIAKGSFEGYRVYRECEEKYGVIIFERETDGSSFIMHKAKAGEFIRLGEGETKLVGSRSDWREKSRTDGSVKSRAHTLNWGKNIIETIVEISSEFKIDDDDERRKYVREETKRLSEVHKDSIEYLRMVKEECVGK